MLLIWSIISKKSFMARCWLYLIWSFEILFRSQIMYLTQEFWMRLDLMNSQIITSQHSPTWQDSNSHCRGNEQAFPISWEQMKQTFLGNTAVQGLSCQAQNQQPELLSAPGSEDSHTLNTPSRAAQVPATAAKDKWGRKQIFFPHATQHADIGLSDPQFMHGRTHTPI